jgi:DNA-binding response OmpR family regulator
MPSILIIDDDINIRNVIKLNLTKENYEVMCAEDALEGISKIATYRPDLIILDIMMPAIDGYEVLNLLKTSDNLNDIPVIMLTAKDEMEDMIRGFNYGADDYLPKPFEIRELSAKIRALLRIKELQRKLIESERMAAIGQIALTIRHEINNPLTAIVGQSEMILKKDKSISPDIRELLEYIYKDGITIKSIVAEIEKF